MPLAPFENLSTVSRVPSRADVSERLIVELRAVGEGPAASIRFRQALKGLLRRHGLVASWRVSRVEERAGNDQERLSD